MSDRQKLAEFERIEKEAKRAEEVKRADKARRAAELSASFDSVPTRPLSPGNYNPHDWDFQFSIQAKCCYREMASVLRGLSTMLMSNTVEI